MLAWRRSVTSKCCYCQVHIGDDDFNNTWDYSDFVLQTCCASRICLLCRDLRGFDRDRLEEQQGVRREAFNMTASHHDGSSSRQLEPMFGVGERQTCPTCKTAFVIDDPECFDKTTWLAANGCAIYSLASGLDRQGIAVDLTVEYYERAYSLGRDMAAARLGQMYWQGNRFRETRL